MTFPSRRLALAGAFAALIPALIPAVAHADERTVPLTKGFPYLKEYWALPPGERSHFVLAYYVELDGRIANGVTAAILDGAQRTALSFDALGKITPLPGADLMRRDAQLRVVWPAGHKMAVNMRLEPTARPATVLSAPDLALAVAQGAKALKKVAGPLGLVVPRLTKVGLFGAPRGEAVSADGTAVALPQKDGALYFVPADHPRATSLRLAGAPSRLQLLS